MVESVEVEEYYKIKLLKSLPRNNYDLIIIAVGHKIFKKIDKKYFSKSLLFDLKSIKKDIHSDFSF